MKLAERIELMSRLGQYLKSDDEQWQAVKRKASVANAWFTEEFIDVAANNISDQLLDQQKLIDWAEHYHLDDNITPKKVGIVMAGNIPLVGFHDLLSVFISGHEAVIKLSSKDDVLTSYLISKLIDWDAEAGSRIRLAEKLADMDAYIATGSNNTARYFEYYFGKYPNIIRRNRTSVALLDGTETPEQLAALADDIHIYFGLGCRNVTKLYVPAEYDFVPLLNACRKYNYLSDHPKYRNNYDYHLALQIMNHRFYMTNETVILLENEQLFTPVSVVYYSFFENKQKIVEQLSRDNNVQAIVGNGHISFGQVQKPALKDYADGIDTMQFLLTL
jgi:hypothetical protein